jgi:hypothetical protein
MKKLLTLGSVFFLFVLGATTFAQTDVTFSVDMNVWQAKDLFDPATDTVWVRGGFNDWGQTMMTETATENVYEVTIPIAEGDYGFKFFFSGSADQWEDNVSDRPLSVGPDPLFAGTYYFDEQNGTYSGVPTSVEFNVDMTLPINQGNVIPGVTNVYVAGNFTEDTSGALLVYKFIYSASDAASGTWESFSEAGEDIAPNRDYNRVYGVVDEDPGLTRFWQNTNPNIELGDGNILFGVDMSVMEEVGIFDPVTDSLQIRAGFNGWNDSNPDITDMSQDFLNPNLFTIQIPFSNTEVGSEQNYKYFVDLADTGDTWKDGYERPLSQGGGNRDVDFEASETQDAGVKYYDDVHPDWVVPEGTTLEVTFNVDMAPAADPNQQAVPFDPAEDEVYWLPEQPAFVRVMGWEDSDTMTVLQLTDDDEDMVYSGTLTVNGPAWNAFEYRYIFRDVSEGTFTQEPAGFADNAYRVRFASMTGPRAFNSPYNMPQDIWTNAEDKSDAVEDQPAGWVNSVRDLDELANKFELSQNYPNPFNPSTLIKFSIPQSNKVTLKVYNLLGQEITTLVNQEMKAGAYEVKFNASQLASGIYFYTINAGNFTSTKKMMLLK